LRKSAEHMRKHGLPLQDMRGEVTLALLDRIDALEKSVFSENDQKPTCRACAAVASEPDSGRTLCADHAEAVRVWRNTPSGIAEWAAALFGPHMDQAKFPTIYRLTNGGGK
jgi:hypothetical protein